ncbi:MAG: hypothetical protein JWO68_2665 [Actinomycetia bacterium]|nr:hypothetical protein [Actinomycetes bacterium]
MWVRSSMNGGTTASNSQSKAMGWVSLGSSTKRIWRSGSTTSYRMGPITVRSGSGASRRLARTVTCSTPREMPA